MLKMETHPHFFLYVLFINKIYASKGVLKYFIITLSHSYLTVNPK